VLTVPTLVRVALCAAGVRSTKRSDSHTVVVLVKKRLKSELIELKFKKFYFQLNYAQRMQYFTVKHHEEKAIFKVYKGT
jgi:hypothetical protein